MTQNFNPDDLTDEQINALADRMSEAVDNTQMSRRDVLKLGSAGLLGAAMGGGGAAAMTGSAEAAVGQGFFGTESNPLDSVFTNTLGNANEPVQDAVLTDAKVQNAPTDPDDVARLDDLGDGGSAARPVPTVIVAASDASTTSGADYTCDGTDDQVQINNAISSLPTAGGTVALTEGTFQLDGPVTDQNRSGVTIQGQGLRSTTLEVYGQINAFDLDDPTAWTIESLEIDGRRTNNGDGSNREQQVGVYIHTGRDFALRNCYVHDTTYSSFRAANDVGSGEGRNFSIVNNRFGSTEPNANDTVADHVSFAGRFTDGATYRAGIVANNLMEECGHQSIEIGYCEGFSSVGNVIYNGGSNPNSLAISHHDSSDGESPPSQAQVIQGNVVVGQDVSGNAVINCEGKEIQIVNNVIWNPVAADAGIDVVERPGYVSTGLVDGNQVVGGGVIADAGIRALADNVVITSNTVRDLGAGAYSIHLDGPGATNSSVNGCIVAANYATDGVQDDGGTNPSAVIGLNQT